MEKLGNTWQVTSKGVSCKLVGEKVNYKAILDV